MAESIARRDAEDVIEATSAGLSPLGFVPELTRQTLTGNGYSIESLDSTPITRAVWDGADIVINMSGISKERAFLDYGKVEDWKVQDPYGNDPELYQRIHEEIQGRVGELAERLRNASAKNAAIKPKDKTIRDHGK